MENVILNLYKYYKSFNKAIHKKILKLLNVDKFNVIGKPN